VDIMTDAFGLIAMINVLCAQSDYPGALQMVEKLEASLAVERSRPFEFEEDFRTARIRVQLASGDLQSAADWADQLPYNGDFQLHPKRYRLTLARIRLAQGKYADVEHLLAGETPPTESGSRITRQIETRLLTSIALAHQNRIPEALALVEDCLRLSEPEGHIRVFINEGLPIQKLIAQWREHANAGPLRDFTDRLLSQFTVEPHLIYAHKKAPPGSHMVEPLTPRELDVLRLLSAGFSNRQIAEKLVLSEGTVKFYVHTVMDKLGVHSRTQAILSAREHHLL
jgi:LuxR family transcriptional regulator, maltose regulon positive regulatory protein